MNSKDRTSSINTRAKRITHPGIDLNIPLADKNWFQTGGPARYFDAPHTPEEFATALSFAREHELPIFVLGQGANILISDDGFDGLVLRPQLQAIVAERLPEGCVQVRVGAGVTMHDLIEWCLENGILGLEEFSGIPGTIGGSVYINLHYYQFLLSQFLIRARVIHRDTGTVQKVDTDWFGFGYNESHLHRGTYFLLDATFALTAAESTQIAYARGRRAEIIRHRNARYPSERTCGSFFRNFLPQEVTLEREGRKVTHVAYYLDRAGVRGELRVGDAIVSHQHANMIVNCGAATSADIAMLARAMQERVQEQFGIVPQPECRLVGFKEHPLVS